VEGADSSIGGGAENAAPYAADNNNKMRVTRSRPGSATSEANAFGVAGAGAAMPLPGANSLLGKSRGVLGVGGGRNSPLLNSPLRAASPRVGEGGGGAVAVPTPPRHDARPTSTGGRRPPVRPLAAPPLVAPTDPCGE
jgi:hypothetical protein